MQVPIDHHEAEVICSDMALSAAATEFRETLDAIDITQRHAARLFGVSPRHIRRWRSGSRRLPHAVAIVIRLLAMKAVTTTQIEQVAVPPIKSPREAAVPPASLASPARTNGNAKPGPPAPLKEAPEQSVLARAKTAALAICALTPEICHWPVGDPQCSDFRFCSRPAAAPPYCNEHRIAAHMTSRPQQAPIGGQKPSSLAAWPPRTGSRDGTERPSHDVGGPRAAPVALSV